MQKDNSVEQIIGKRIQKLRQEKGYTQQQFAEKIHLSANYLSDIERGNSSARLDKLVTISRLAERLDALPPEEQEKAMAILEAFIRKTV